ncbi:GNAT family N-acetyltransferase [Desulfoglaeba alkanexedens]|nr:GNAT family N-acetyltransferase [Desulfoglaeba alkanexedens]
MKRIVVLHSEVIDPSRPDEEDVLVQARSVSEALAVLGFEPVRLPFSLNMDAAARNLRDLSPCLVFNLVETVGGLGRLIHLAPALLDALGIPYSGSSTEALFATSNKLLAKRWMNGARLPTPSACTLEDLRRGMIPEPGPYIVKSVWEHASAGLFDDAVVSVDSPEKLVRVMEERRERLGGDVFAERFIDGREFNLSLLGGAGREAVLPPAEIRFDAFPPGKPRIVDFRAKWEAGSFEYHHTPRRFDFSEEDHRLLEEMKALAKACWRLFGVSGYARVDFRVDSSGNPWILEVNANPCIAPDSGFVAAAERAGLTMESVVAWILQDMDRPPDANPPGRRKMTPCFAFDAAAERGLKMRSDVLPEDIQAVRDLIGASGFFSAEEVEVAAELVEERLRRGSASGYHFLFLEDAGRLLGYACFGPVAGTRGSFDLYWIAVQPDLRRGGIGRHLLSRVEESVQALGGRRLYIETSSRSLYEPTRAFYHRCGYARAALLQDFYASGDHKVIFVKVFPPA